jgi:GNAT superfamily N-acetyltransferase
VTRVIRPAVDGDRDILLAWRNDPDDYRWYGTPEPVDARTHAAWLAARLAAHPPTLWVVEEDGIVRGSVRIDPDGGATGSVSVVVDPAARGRGLAALLVAHLEGVAPALGLTRLEASVHGGNEPSLRLFRSGGYVPERVDGPFTVLVRTLPPG